MYLVAIGWLYVVLMMAVAEAMSSQGTVLGAIITFIFYGLLPASIVLYIMGTGARRKARLRADAAALGGGASVESSGAADRRSATVADADAGGHAPADAAAGPVRKEQI
jgi:hypothetical protein